jgi:glycosyltransferase involved in cell wall biosynthesis
MKILFLTDNFPPEVNAPATRTYEHCREWANKGVDVTVITCVPNFPIGRAFDGYKNKLFQTEYIDEIRVIRVWSYITENSGILRRVLDHVSFGITSFIIGLFVKTDVIIATSPQFFTAISGKWLSFFKRRKWILEIRDIWPEQIVHESGMKVDSYIYKYLERVEKRLYKSANSIIVVTNSFKSNIEKKIGNPDKIFTITNGANIDLYKPRAKSQSLINRLGLHDKVVFAYFGTIGMAHNIEFIVEGFKKLPVFGKNAHLLIIGEGAKKKELRFAISKEKTSNVTILDLVSKEKMPEYISIIDYAIVNLRKAEEYKTVIPSKIFEFCAMGKPILLGVEGESKEIIESNNCGLCYEPDSETSFFKAIKKTLELDDEMKTVYKVNCFNTAKKYNRKDLSKRMLNIIIDTIN